MKNNSQQRWKEKTKLDKRNKIVISVYILIAIFEVIVAITEKNFTWLVCAILWGSIAIMEYCNVKLLKGRDMLIEVQDEHIEIQNKMINKLLKKISEQKTMVKIENIKIPKKFRKPNPNKLKDRIDYYRQYNNFKTPIVIDKDNNLIDGYTSYLIAKKYNLEIVKVEVR